MLLICLCYFCCITHSRQSLTGGHDCLCVTFGAIMDTLVCRENMLKGGACAEPKIFNFKWEPFSTEVAGVEVEANLFNVAPCAILVNARGVKVRMAPVS